MILVVLTFLTFAGHCFNSDKIGVKLNTNKIEFLTSNGKFQNKSIQLTDNCFNNCKDSYKGYNSLNKYKDSYKDNYNNYKDKHKDKILGLPNTVLINNNLRNRPVLSVDFNNGKVSVSFNFGNRFELLGSLPFTNYKQLTLQILNLVNNYSSFTSFGGLTSSIRDTDKDNNYNNYNNNNDYENLLVLMGIPFNYHNSNVYSSLYGFSNENHRLLFQILYILDYCSYLSYYLNRNSIINLYNRDKGDIYPHQDSNYPHLNPTSSTTTNNPTTTNANKEKEDKEEEEMVVDTYCLYCSLNPNNCNSYNSNNYNSNNTNNPNGCKDNPNSTCNSYKSCLLNNKLSCRNRINLNKLNHLVLAVSEQLSSYQTSSISFNCNNNCNNNNNYNSNKYNNKHHKDKKDKDSLSTLNIYYNFLNSNTFYSNNQNNCNNSNISYKDYKDRNVVVLPNCNPVFDKGKSHNLLLFNQIKQFIQLYIHFSY